MRLSEQIKLCMTEPRDFTRVDYTDPSNVLNYRQAIRMKCLDCCCGDKVLVRTCAIKSCALYPFSRGLSYAKWRTPSWTQTDETDREGLGQGGSISGLMDDKK